MSRVVRCDQCKKTLPDVGARYAHFDVSTCSVAPPPYERGRRDDTSPGQCWFDLCLPCLQTGGALELLGKLVDARGLKWGHNE